MEWLLQPDAATALPHLHPSAIRPSSADWSARL